MKTDEAISFCKHRHNLACIPIWHPLYSENRVLLACNKVRDFNIIKFTKAQSMPGLYYVSGKNVRKYTKRSNGRIACYPVPLEELSPFSWDERCIHSY